VAPWARKRSHAPARETNGRACCVAALKIRGALGEEEEPRAGEGDGQPRLLRGGAEDSWEVSGGCDTRSTG
jgi:hypothetical protein